jgi:hypothetical protein
MNHKSSRTENVIFRELVAICRETSLKKYQTSLVTSFNDHQVSRFILNIEIKFYNIASESSKSY